MEKITISGMTESLLATSAEVERLNVANSSKNDDVVVSCFHAQLSTTNFNN